MDTINFPITSLSGTSCHLYELLTLLSIFIVYKFIVYKSVAGSSTSLGMWLEDPLSEFVNLILVKINIYIGQICQVRLTRYTVKLYIPLRDLWKSESKG